MSKIGKLLLSLSMLLAVLFTFTAFANAEWNKAAEVTGDNVNLRAKPSTSADVVTKVNKGADVNIISESDGWYNVSIGGKKGWISAQFVSVKKAAANKAKILAENVNLRSDPSTSAKVVTKLSKGEDVSVVENSGEWFKVTTSGNKTGWVYKNFISAKAPTTPVTKTASRAEVEIAPVKQAEALEKPEADKKDSDSGKAQKIVEYAKQFMGVKYVYGGSSPKGFDCSGFTSYVFKNFGIKLERVAANQAGQGKKVSKAELKAGDLVFFDTDGKKNYICHVGIYLGDGKFIHASSGRNSKRVVISDLSEGFYENAYMTARRFLD